MLLNSVKAVLDGQKFRKFLIYGIGQAVNLIGPILVIPYTVHVVGEKGLGKVGIGMSLAYILIVVVDYSSYIKSVREVAVNRDNPQVLKNTLATVYLAKFYLLLFVFSLVTLACSLIPYFRSETILYVLSMCIVLGQFVNPTWFLQGVEDFVTISIINVSSKLIYLAGVFLLVSSIGDYIYVNMWLGLGVFLPSLVVFARLFLKYKVSMSDMKSAKAIRLIRRDFTFCVSQLLFAFRQYSPILLVDMIGGSVLAGQFKIIEQIVMLFRTYFQMVFKFSFPVVSFELGQNLQNGLQTWKKINGYNLLLVSGLLVATIVGSQYILAFFHASKMYLSMYHSLLKLAIFIPFFVGITLAQEQLMFSFEKNTHYIRITVFITVFSTILLLSLLWRFGLKGAFSALLATEILLMLIYHELLKKVYWNRAKTNAQ